jgi:hypothetical protein
VETGNGNTALIFGVGAAAVSVRDVTVSATSDSTAVTAVFYQGVATVLENVSISALGSSGNTDAGIYVNAPTTPLSLELRNVDVTADTALVLGPRNTSIPSGPVRVVNSRLKGSVSSISLAPPIPGGSQLGWTLQVVGTGLAGSVANASSVGCIGNPSIPCYNSLRCVGTHSETDFSPLDASCREVSQWVLAEESGQPAIQRVPGDTAAVAPGVTSTLTAECPSGWVAIGGGWDRVVYPGDLDVTISRASNSTTPPTAWIVELENKTGGTLYPRAEVMCARFRRLLNH